MVTTIDISVRGRWVSVPAVRIGNNHVVVNGNWLRIASIHDEAWLEDDVQDPREYIQALKNQALGALRCDIFNFRQKTPEPRFQYPYEWDSVAAMSLTSFDKWWTALSQETRKNVRRAEKRGVEVRAVDFGEELINGIIGVNDDSPIRQGRRNDHFGKSFQQVERDQSAFVDRSTFICAYSGVEMIGFIKLVSRRETASILNLAVKATHHDKRPANALVAEAVKICTNRGYERLTYGMFRYGSKREDPLREFKSRNGFEELLLPRYFVPLNIWGALCMKGGLHRDLRRLVPSEVHEFIVRSRTMWYKWYYTNGKVRPV